MFLVLSHRLPRSPGRGGTAPASSVGHRPGVGGITLFMAGAAVIRIKQ